MARIYLNSFYSVNSKLSNIETTRRIQQCNQCWYVCNSASESSVSEVVVQVLNRCRFDLFMYCGFIVIYYTLHIYFDACWLGGLRTDESLMTIETDLDPIGFVLSSKVGRHIRSFVFTLGPQNAVCTQINGDDTIPTLLESYLVCFHEVQPFSVLVLSYREFR